MLSIGLVWAGYTLAFYGYCLIKSYDVTLLQLVNPLNLTSTQNYSAIPLTPAGAPVAIQHWPPTLLAAPTVVIPNGIPAGPNSAAIPNPNNIYG
jgi:hypothetical protein